MNLRAGRLCDINDLAELVKRGKIDEAVTIPSIRIRSTGASARTRSNASIPFVPVIISRGERLRRIDINLREPASSSTIKIFFLRVIVLHFIRPCSNSRAESADELLELPGLTGGRSDPAIKERSVDKRDSRNRHDLFRSGISLSAGSLRSRGCKNSLQANTDECADG